ncbi:MAG: HAD-IA family hydrolase [Ferruginibacter sp.]
MQKTEMKILFLDVGGVLLSNGWGHESRAAAAKEFNLNYDDFNRLHEFIFNVYEIGNLTLEEYLDTVIFNQPRDFTKEDFKSFMYAQSFELPGMLQWVIEWKNLGCPFRIISINNEPKELNDYRIKKFRLHRCYDAFISSCEVGMRKPDPRIFKLAMGVAQAAPEQCYYFDDRPMLVEAAARLGIHAFHHTGFESSKSIIENL